MSIKKKVERDINIKLTIKFFSKWSILEHRAASGALPDHHLRGLAPQAVHPSQAPSSRVGG